MNYNPFITGAAVKNPAHFVGRIRESSDILAKIQTHNSVSVVGERRIGKSSLLYYLAHGCKVQTPNRKVLYLDFMDAEMKTLEGFVQLVLDFLKIDHNDDAALKANPNLFLTRNLRRLNMENNEQPPVVFLDEFDKIQQLPTLFNDDFLENLRFLCNSGYLCLVTGSKMPLKDMVDRAGLTSPFWNVFTHTPLKEFVVESALDERELFLMQYWRDELTPTDEEMRFLLSYTSAHPLVMQIVSFHVCNNRYQAVKRSEDQLRDKIEQDIQSHFRDSKENIRQWLYSSSVTLPKKIEWTSEFIGKVLKNLNPLKDLKIIG